MQILAKYIIIAGAVLVVLGALILLAGKVPWLGRLPGDIVVQREGFSFYFPVTTCIILSVILSLVFYFIGRR